MPTMALTIAHRRAFCEDSWAPATSPAAHLLLTCAAKTIDTMPKGRQQKSVVRIAQTRWLGGGAPCGAP